MIWFFMGKHEGSVRKFVGEGEGEVDSWGRIEEAKFSKDVGFLFLEKGEKEKIK